MIETVNDMRVTKRDGKLENIAFDKIVNRIKKLGNEANIKLNYSSLTMKVIDQLYDTISTAEIDELTAQQCAVMASHNPDYNVLAGRVVISNHQKNTRSTFFEVVSSLYTHKNNTTNEHEPICSHELFITAQKNADIIEEMIDYDRDYLIDYFGFKTLERAYLFKINNQMVELPQHMWMRVALCLHGNDMTLVK